MGYDEEILMLIEFKNWVIWDISWICLMSFLVMLLIVVEPGN